MPKNLILVGFCTKKWQNVLHVELKTLVVSNEYGFRKNTGYAIITIVKSFKPYREQYPKEHQLVWQKRLPRSQLIFSTSNETVEANSSIFLKIFSKLLHFLTPTVPSFAFCL